MNHHLNIVTFNIPYPPDYGGVIDVFYRIKALCQSGIKIHLHCFEYGREKSRELEAMCQTVHYYKRRKGLHYQFSALPYIVNTRCSEELVKNLSSNPYPILFDGLHTTFCLCFPQFKDRIKLVRMHNVEHKYYGTLAGLEKNAGKKAYLMAEAIKLKRYEKILRHASHIVCVSLSEYDYFNNRYHNAVFISSSHPYNSVEGIPGYGNFILYHGDLSVTENEQIAASLVREVFSQTEYPCIIAGKNPPSRLKALIDAQPNIRLIANPGTAEMHNLLTNAHIHVLPALQSNGLKLKLLLALYSGRHCLVNRTMVEGTGLTPLCSIALTPREMVEKINILIKEPFTHEMLILRKELLFRDYDNLTNAQRLLNLLGKPCNQKIVT